MSVFHFASVEEGSGSVLLLHQDSDENFFPCVCVLSFHPAGSS